MSLLYNPASKKLLDRIVLDMPHALLLDGPDGVGLATIARDIAWHDLAGVIQSTDADGNVDTSTKGSIRISQVRELIQSTRGKLTSRRVYVIDDIDKMTLQSQNAFLKLLEEPNEFTSFILTTHRPQQLLPTVLSRVQRVHIGLVSDADSRAFIKKNGISDTRKTEQLLFLASGLPAELTRLIKDEARFATQSKYVADARTLLQGTPYERAMIAHKYHGDRVSALDMLTLGQRIARHSLQTTATEALVARTEHLANTYERIAANGNIRLQLMDFVLQ